MRLVPDGNMGDGDPEIFPLNIQMRSVEILQRLGLYGDPKKEPEAGGVLLHIDPIFARFERELVRT